MTQTRATTDAGIEPIRTTEPSPGGTTASGAGTPLKDRVADATARLVEQTQEKVREEVRTRLDSGRRRTSDTLSTIAASLRQGDVRDDETARFMQKASDQVQRLSSYLENTDVKQLTREAEDAARRQPVLFLASAFILGLGAARFFRAGRDRGRSGPSLAQTTGDSEPGFRPMPDDPTIGRQGPVHEYPGSPGFARPL